jgi:hypothetical protein
LALQSAGRQGLGQGGIRALIGSHGGKDISFARPAATFVRGVFSKAEAAKAFRDNSRRCLQAG